MAKRVRIGKNSKLAKITGLDELQQKLDDLNGAADSKDVENLLVRCAFIIKNKARELVPVDTGNLRDSIVATPGKQKAGKPISAVVTITRKTGAYYANQVEYGNFKQAPQPFMRPAANQSKPEVVETLKVGLKMIIDDIVS